MVIRAISAAAFLCALGCGGRAESGGDAAPRASRGAAADLSGSARESRDAEIEFYRARAARDTSGFLDLAQLGGLYLQRARETGDHADIHRAEEAARRSFANSGERRAQSLALLANALVAQHKFGEALDAARRLCALEPDEVAYRAIRGEIELELGDYDAAHATFEALADFSADPAVLPRLARWAELTGRLDDAIAMMRSGRDAAANSRSVTREQAAWYALRLGDLLAKRGRLDEAVATYRDGLARRPDDHRLHAAIARAEWSRADWPSAIIAAERSLAIATEPATLALLGDAYLASGDSARAAGAFEWAESLWLSHAEAYPRGLYSHLLDQDRDAAATLARLEDEIKTRPDIYGYDLLAWARYKSGDLRGAQAAIDGALSTGVDDALIRYHAGVIARACGDPGAGREHLRSACALNPYFHPALAGHARELADSLAGS